MRLIETEINPRHVSKGDKKNQNGRLKKTEFFKIGNSQNCFVKISWIGPWVSMIELAERALIWLNLYGCEDVRRIRAKTA